MISQDDGQDNGKMARMLTRMITKSMDHGPRIWTQVCAARDPGPAQQPPGPSSSLLAILAIIWIRHHPV